jgi:protein tyrosine phosphatase
LGFLREWGSLEQATVSTEIFHGYNSRESQDSYEQRNGMVNRIKFSIKASQVQRKIKSVTGMRECQRKAPQERRVDTFFYRVWLDQGTWIRGDVSTFG